MPTPSHKACLIVIDGWGIPTADSHGDAITNANTPVMDELYKSTTGFTELEASSLAVGLPEGLMGNSEVGHLNIGAGRVVWQDVVRIDQTIKKNELGKNEVISRALQAAKNGNGRLHLCGLVSHGGVVSSSPSPPPPGTTLTSISTRNKPTYTPFSRRPRLPVSPRSSSTSLATVATPIPSLAQVIWRN